MKSILIIDDSRAFRETVREILKPSFPETFIAEAPDASSAFRKIQEHPPDVVLMDLNLPDENGISLTRRIKSGFPGIHVIFLTAHNLPEYREAAFLAGADLYLSKEVSTSEKLIQSISLLIAECSV